MGLYDDRLLELSETRRSGRVAQRRPASPVAPRRSNPMLRPSAPRTGVVEAKPSMDVQSLLFGRDAGWTPSKAKAWAKSQGYLYGKVDVTDQYVRIRQFDPKGSKVFRTIPFGRGIRAVVAREESSMRTTTARRAPRRAKSAKRRPAKKTARRAAPKRARRKSKKVHAVAARRRKRTVRVEAKRSRRRRVARTTVMAPKRRRRVKRRTTHAEAWKGDSAGHAKAARKGHRRSKARKAARKGRRKTRKTREATYAAAPKRRRSKRRSAREPMVMEAKRSKRRYHARASTKRGSGMTPGEFALMFGMGGLGFVLSDGLDRLIATYDPSATGDPPKDKFTSTGTGSLANTLNIAARPGIARIAAGIGLTAAPAVGAYFVDNKYAKGALEGLAVGAGINLFKSLWSNLLMPMLIGKDTSVPTLQKSYIARLYPAEVAAHINLAALKEAAPDKKMPAGPYPANGVLSGATDVGPFALSGDSPYPSAADVLRQQTGVHGDSPYPTAAEVLRQAAGVSGDSPYPTAADALRAAAGVGYQPGPPPGPGPGPQAEPGTDPSCGCVGDPGKINPFSGFVGGEESDAA